MSVCGWNLYSCEWSSDVVLCCSWLNDLLNQHDSISRATRAAAASRQPLTRRSSSILCSSRKHRQLHKTQRPFDKSQTRFMTEETSDLHTGSSPNKSQETSHQHLNHVSHRQHSCFSWQKSAVTSHTVLYVSSRDLEDIFWQHTKDCDEPSDLSQRWI